MTRVAWLLLGILVGVLLVVAALDQGWVSESSVHRGLRPYAWQREEPARAVASTATTAAPAPERVTPAAASAPMEWPAPAATAPLDPLDPLPEDALATEAAPESPAGSLTNTVPASAAPLPDASSLPMPPPLAGAGLLIPVRGILPKQLSDTYTQSRGAGRLHDAIDIMAPRGTPVVAVADGRIAKLFNSKPGGLTVYQFDPEEKLAYYYAHLDAYAPQLAEGSLVRRGDLIGFVGSTGNANPDAPHLHFAVFVLGPEKRWWQGTPLNPYPLLGGG
jgi:murein DD-endopeptidase MepM/ murein hydrolase activator NlpD